MVFSSLTFLYVFLPLVLIAYYLVPSNGKILLFSFPALFSLHGRAGIRPANVVYHCCRLHRRTIDG